MTKKNVITLGLAIIVCIVVIVLALPVTALIFEALGYHVTSSERELAEYIVKNNMGAEECLKLIQVDIFEHPSNADKRAGCILELAKLRKDPTICEPLLPSNYGMYCIGNVRSLEPDSECFLEDSKNMLCNGQEGQIEFSWRDCHENLKDPLMRDWCIIAKVFWDPSFDDCSKLLDKTNHLDECEFGLAAKLLNIQICERIKNDIRRTACQVIVKAHIKYPELRN